MSTIQYKWQKGSASEDPRHIFPYIHEIVKQIRPSYCVFENVYGHVSMGLDEASLQWKALTTKRGHLLFRLSSIGARHKRDRVWIICKNLGDSYYHGLSTTKIGRSNEEVARGCEERSEETKQFEGASGSQDNGDVSNSNDQRLRSCIGGTDNDLQKESGEGELTEAEAQSMMNGVTLRPPRMEEWKFPTPNSGLKKHSYNGNNQYYEKRLIRWQTSGSHNEDVSNRGRCET